MRTVVLILLFVCISATYANSFRNVNTKLIDLSQTEDYVEDLQLFCECMRKAMDGGLNAANLPDHNPLRLPQSFTIPLSIININANATIHDILVENIITFNFTNLTAEITGNTAAYQLIYNYTVYFESLNFKGLWDVEDLTSGTFHISLKDFYASGTLEFEQTIADHKVRALDFSLETIADVDALVRGSPLDGILSALLQIGTEAVIQHLPNELVNNFIRDYINSDWVNQPSKIKAIVENCYP